MTLDEVLKQWKWTHPNKVDQLIAALKKCREFRDEQRDDDQWKSWRESCDQDLLNILQGKNE